MVYLAARENSLVVVAVVKALYRDRDLDVAILECDTAEFSSLILPYAASLGTYEPIYTVDIIGHSYATVHKGSYYPVMNARTFQGFNGGPILDERGEVVGIPRYLGRKRAGSDVRRPAPRLQHGKSVGD